MSSEPMLQGETKPEVSVYVDYLEGLEAIVLAAILYCGQVDRYGFEGSCTLEQYDTMNEEFDRWANRNNPDWRPA